MLETVASLAASSAIAQVVKQLAAEYAGIANSIPILVASKELSDTVQKIARSESFNAFRLTAASAAQAAVRGIYELHSDVIQNIGRSVAAEVASLSSVFAGQLEAMEEQRSLFARQMAQTLRTSFEELGQQNLQSLVTLKSIDEKLDTLPEKTGEPQWARQLERLAHFIAIAAFVLAVIQYVESSKTKNQPALVEQCLKIIEEMARRAEEKINTKYIVDRNVPLKSKPTNKSVTLSLLVVGDEVRYIETGSHQWILVEYDEGSTTLRGWVNKKYLRRAR